MNDQDPTPKKRKRSSPHTVADEQTADFLLNMREATGISIVVRSWSPGGDHKDESSIKWTGGIPRSAAAAVLWRAALKLDPDIANLLNDDDEDALTPGEDEETED